MNLTKGKSQVLSLRAIWEVKIKTQEKNGATTTYVSTPSDSEGDKNRTKATNNKRTENKRGRRNIMGMTHRRIWKAA